MFALTKFSAITQSPFKTIQIPNQENASSLSILKLRFIGFILVVQANDLMNEKYKKKTTAPWELFGLGSCVLHLTWLLSSGALCRRKDRVSDGGAEEDYQRWSQDPLVHPVSNRAQEADTRGRNQGHLCV